MGPPPNPPLHHPNHQFLTAAAAPPPPQPPQEVTRQQPRPPPQAKSPASEMMRPPPAPPPSGGRRGRGRGRGRGSVAVANRLQGSKNKLLEKMCSINSFLMFYVSVQPPRWTNSLLSSLLPLPAVVEAGGGEEGQRHRPCSSNCSSNSNSSSFPLRLLPHPSTPSALARTPPRYTLPSRRSRRSRRGFKGSLQRPLRLPRRREAMEARRRPRRKKTHS